LSLQQTTLYNTHSSRRVIIIRSDSNLGAVSSPLLLNPGHLAGGELVHASILSVVHEVVYKSEISIFPSRVQQEELTDGVNTSNVGAGIAADGASISSGGLSGGVGNRVTRAAATTLESMVETEPVTNLVSQSLAEVVRGRSTAGDAGEEDDNTIVLGLRGVGRGESSISQKTSSGARDETDGVDVEVLGCALAVGVLHGGLDGGGRANGVEPVGVGHPVGGGEGEAEARPSIGGVEDADRVGELLGTVESVSINLSFFFLLCEKTNGMAPPVVVASFEMTCQ